MKKILQTSLLAIGVGLSGQVAGSKTIGLDYPTVSAAFTDLNANGVASGGVILNIPAGYTETAPVGGYSLGSTALNATLSPTSQLIIQKSGLGDNPLFTGNTGTSSTLDAIFKFSGVDHMTLDGIDLKENISNTTAVTLNERGFAFYNLTGADGCNYNTIKNCKITFLKNLNNPAIAIMFVHTSSTGTAINPTASTGTHSNNKVYSNIISRSIGSAINFTGYSFAPAPYTLYDQDNDIGGTGTSTGNTLIDIGGMAGGNYTTTNYGLYNTYQNNCNVSNNLITFSTDGMGTVGIYVAGNNSQYTTNNNTIYANGQTNSSTGTQHIGIYANSTGLRLTANNNVVKVSATTFNGTSQAYGIWSQNASGDLTANGNIITVSGNDATYGIYSNTSGSILNIGNNTIRDIATSGSSNASGIYANSTALQTNIFNNRISDVSSNGTLASAYGLYVGGTTVSSNANIYNNLIGNIRTPNVNDNSPSLVGIYLAARGATSNINVYYNNVNLNGVSKGANFNSSGIFHTYNVNATTASLDLRNNIIVNTSTPNGNGTASAIRRNSAADLNNYAMTSNNNDLVVGPSGFIYFNGTTKFDFEAFKIHVATREASSLSLSPQFISVSGADTDYLKLNKNASNNEQLDNKGTSINGFNLDLAGLTRDSATPDMGAYEFTYSKPTTVPECTTIEFPTDQSTGIIPNPVTVNWKPSNYASSYKLYVGTTPGGAEILNGNSITTLSYTLNLDKNKIYYIKVVPSNDIGDATGCSESSFSTTEYSFCTPTFLNVEPITNVTFAGINNSSSSILNGTPGYENFTTITGNVESDKNYTISVSGNTNDSRTSYYVVFIDWNQNGILNDPGEVYFSNGSLSNSNSNGVDGITASGLINVPADAKLGQTRMRIKKEYSFSLPSSTGNFANPCDKAQNYGQAEDYTLNVTKNETLNAMELNEAKTKLYPNPFSDVLKISNVKDINFIYISDISGKHIKTLMKSAQIDLRELNTGMYIINLQMNNGNVKTFKVIKK